MVVFVELQPRKPATNVDGFGTFVEDSCFVCVTASLEEARITKKIFTFATKINFFGSLMAITKFNNVQVYVLVQFHFWFKYYFSLFLSLAVQYDNELETEENKFKPLHKSNRNFDTECKRRQKYLRVSARIIPALAHFFLQARAKPLTSKNAFMTSCFFFHFSAR